MPGTGVRTAGALAAFLELVELLQFPVATAFNAHDLLWDDHPSYVGRPGTVGDRAGNFAVQNADCLLVLGCRLNIRQISYNWRAFAPHAHQIMVDIDAAELAKPTLGINQPVHADLVAFLPLLVEELQGFVPSEMQRDYLAWCLDRRARYPVVDPAYARTEQPVNAYVFADALFSSMGPEDVVVTANATATIITFQAARLRPGQRMFSNSGSASMGYDLPAAIGAAYAAEGGRIVCIAGDGSIMMNLQELQSIAAQQLPITIFLLNNRGYSSILQTQSAFFADNIFGCNPESGVTFPDFQAIAAAFGLPSRRVSCHADLPAAIAASLAAPGPQICEIMLDPAQVFAPKLASRRLEDGTMVSPPLDDMAPFLSREELAQNRVVPTDG